MGVVTDSAERIPSRCVVLDTSEPLVFEENMLLGAANRQHQCYRECLRAPMYLTGVVSGLLRGLPDWSHRFRFTGGTSDWFRSSLRRCQCHFTTWHWGVLGWKELIDILNRDSSMCGQRGGAWWID